MAHHPIDPTPAAREHLDSFAVSSADLMLEHLRGDHGVIVHDEAHSADRPCLKAHLTAAHLLAHQPDLVIMPEPRAGRADFQVTQLAAARSATEKRRRTVHPVSVEQVSAELLLAALICADGDASRLQIVSPTEIIVLNTSKQGSK